MLGHVEWSTGKLWIVRFADHGCEAQFSAERFGHNQLCTWRVVCCSTRATTIRIGHKVVSTNIALRGTNKKGAEVSPGALLLSAGYPEITVESFLSMISSVPEIIVEEDGEIVRR
jgi:hypothetical protein